jgi:hypothetical protein
MIKVMCVFAVLVLTGGIALAQMPTPIGLEWDANTEADLVGYYVYEATTSNGQVLTAFSYPPVLAPEHSITFINPHSDGQYYWKVTAYDTAANESGFSAEVTADFNLVPPTPPTGCSVRF